MKKKSILIVSHAMEIGGAERALLGLLENIDTDQFDVDLFLMHHRGEFMDSIPGNINLLPENSYYTDFAIPIASVIKKGHIRVAMGRIFGKVKAAQKIKQLDLPPDNGVTLEYSHKYTVQYMPMISDHEYDMAISFLTPHYFVREKVNAKKRAAWIHTDYASFPVDTESEHQMWNKYDTIFSISEDCTRSFCSIYPDLEERIKLFENIMPERMIRMQARVKLTDDISDAATTKLLTVGRFSYQKNMENIPDICARLVKHGVNIKWYLLGYGSEEKLIRRKIEETKMMDRVIVLGKKNNPYPYFEECDLYVQPSRYEGKCVAVREAQMLGKPVIITNYATSSSQLEDGVDGMIVPMDNEGCAKGIEDLLRDPEKMEELRNNCRSRDYSNKKEISKLYHLMNEDLYEHI